MHWNILADKLSDAFPKVPEEYLKWQYRFKLII
jgi:mRNA deadenylase 3'-5' endonuclease subunit Ccr4